MTWRDQDEDSDSGRSIRSHGALRSAPAWSCSRCLSLAAIMVMLSGDKDPPRKVQELTLDDGARRLRHRRRLRRRRRSSSPNRR